MKEPVRRRAISGLAPRGWILPAAAIVAVTLLAWLPAMRGGFLWDDVFLVSDNPLIKARDGLRRIWLTTEAPEYLPLTFTMHWAEWRLWGGRPEGHHAVNVLLHASAAVLLWRVLQRLRVPGPFDPAQRDRPEGNRMGGAWLAGLLFAVHPVAVGSVAWISERKNVLSMTLYLLSLLAYLKFDDGAGNWEIGRLGNWEIGRLGNSETAQSPNLLISKSPNLRVSVSPRLRVYFLSLFLFLLTLLAKTSVVMLPVILLLCAWWRRGRISRKDMLRSVPFFALSLALGLVTVWFQQHNAIGAGTVRPEGFASRVAAAGWIAWFYLFKTLIPVGLCAIYPRWNVPDSALAFVPLLLLLGGIAFLWTRRNSWGRAPLLASACFLIMLLPVLGFVDMSFMQHSLVSDHLQYAAMIAVIAFGAGILAKAAGAPARNGIPGVLAAAGCAAVLGILTWNRASLYSAGERLWQDNVAKNPASWAAWNEAGNAASDAGHYRQAAQCFDHAILLKPGSFQAYNNRGLAFYRMGRMNLAFADYDRAIKLERNYAQTYYNRGLALSDIKDFTGAIRDYGRAISLKGGFADAYYNRGWAYAQVHDLDKAIEDYGRAIFLDPGRGAAYNNRGAAYERLGLHEQAVRDYSAAIERMPDNPALYVNRATAYYELGEYARACEDVKAFEKLGGRPAPEFLKALEHAAQRPK